MAFYSEPNWRLISAMRALILPILRARFFCSSHWHSSLDLKHWFLEKAFWHQLLLSWQKKKVSSVRSKQRQQFCVLDDVADVQISNPIVWSWCLLHLSFHIIVNSLSTKPSTNSSSILFSLDLRTTLFYSFWIAVAGRLNIFKVESCLNVGFHKVAAHFK